MKSRADLVCPDSGKDLYPLGLVKVLIIWIPMGKTHFLWHLEVRRVIFYPTMKFALLFLAEGPDLHALWVVRLHLWMVDHPFKERMRIHQQLDIRKRPDIEFTPFGVNSLKFPCLPHLRKYLLPLILCRAQVW
jgi:hypothetical protein